MRVGFGDCERELLARLRTEHGLPVRYHLLADVLLRTDFWLGDALVCVYFPNARYKSKRRGRKPEERGRKPRAAKFFGRAEPPFRISDIEVSRQGYGKLWTLDDGAVGRVARALEAGG